MSLRSSLALLFLCLTALPLVATDIVWPTTMERSDFRTPQDYLQPTISGKTESALFGMVREDGKRFHEGIDIRPAKSNADGEPLDLVLAAMDGQVAYLNTNVNGPYGRYVVLHPPLCLLIYHHRMTSPYHTSLLLPLLILFR